MGIVATYLAQCSGSSTTCPWGGAVSPKALAGEMGEAAAGVAEAEAAVGSSL